VQGCANSSCSKTVNSITVMNAGFFIVRAVQIN
jgi:hypothetical protein